MQLKDLSIETKSVEVPFKGLDGFKVTIGYLGKSITRRLAQESTTQKMDGNGNVVQDFDQDSFTEAFCKEAIKDWSGLKYKHLTQLMLIDEAQIEDMEAELPFSHDNAYVLLKESTIFDNWVNERVNDLATFRS